MMNSIISSMQSDRYKYSVLLLLLTAFAILSAIMKNWYYIIAYIVLVIIFLFEKKDEKISALVIFLTLYGVFARIMFALTGGFAFNIVFVIPAFLILLYADRVIASFRSMRIEARAALSVYLLIIIYSIYFVRGGEALFKNIALNVFVSPVFLMFALKNNDEKLLKTIAVIYPFIAIFGICQYFGFYTVFDEIWIKVVSPYAYTSLSLGAIPRPFSSFTSAEEFSYFLGMTALFPIFNRNRYYIFISAVSVFLLIIFSVRLPIFALIATILYYLIKKGMKKTVSAILAVIIITVVLFRFVPYDTSVDKTDSRTEVILKHSIEPVKKLFNTYSIRKRIESLKIVTADLKVKPFGGGLSHNSKTTYENLPERNYESSAVQLIAGSGLFGILFFAGLIVSILFSMRRKMNSPDDYISFYLFLTVILGHGLSFHLLTPLMFYYLIRRFNG